MKLKEIPRTATFAWSPKPGNPFLVTGTAAGAIDPDFSSTTELELWDLDLANRSGDSFSVSSPAAKLETDARFHDIAFSSNGKYIAGALESGAVDIWEVTSTKNKSNPYSLSLFHHGENHSGGPVKSVAFNPLESQKLASGGANGQVLVWDLDSVASPTSPGAQTSRHDEIAAVAWNNRVAHILASGGNTGFTSIWDLKKRREVIHLHYSTAAGTRVPVSSVSWHPSNSTKLVTTSLDDNEPVVLVWDLRNANSPETVLKGHQRGVLSSDWCDQDPNLLLTCGKDNRTLLWNPVAGELLGEYPVSVEWTFKAKFNPRTPDVLASASFDGKVVVQTLQDTAEDNEKPAASGTKSADDFWESPSVVDSVHPHFKLHQAPIWLKRPASASFGFGGKIAVVRTVDGKSSVSIQQVKDNSFPEDTAKFGEALKADDLEKIVETHDLKDSDWKLLNQLVKKEDYLSGVPGYPKKTAVKDAQDATNGVDDGDESVFDAIAGESKTKEIPAYTPTGDFKLLNGKEDDVTERVLADDIPGAVNKLLETGNVADALLLASYGDESLLKKAQNAYLSANGTKSPYLRAAWGVAGGNLDDLADKSDISSWAQVLSAVLAKSNPGPRTALLGTRLEKAKKRDDAVLVYLAGGNLGKAAALWLSELPELEKTISKDGKSSPYVAHVKALQQVIEKITVASRSLPDGTATTGDDDILFDAYRDYADIVASQGDLDLAKIFLDLLPAKFSQEKERVAGATKPQVTSSATSRRSAQRSTVNQHAYPASPAAQNNTSAAASGNPYAQRAPQSFAPSSNGAATAPGAGAPNYFQPARSSPMVSLNPYAGAATAAASVASQAAQAAAGAIPSATSPPPASGISRPPSHGWNDLPEMNAKNKRKPAAPQIISPAYAQPVAAPTAPPKSAAGGPKMAPPPPKSVPGVAAPNRAASSATSPYAPPPGTTSTPGAPLGPRAPVGANDFSSNGQYNLGPTPNANSAPVRGPPPAASNPYAPKTTAGESGSRTSPYAPPPGSVSQPITPASSMAGPPAPRGPSNPYAPGPPTAGPSASSPAPPPAAAPVAPPPKGSAPPKSAVAPANSAVAAVMSQDAGASPAGAAAAPKYPAGDRSHIPSDAQPIVSILGAELERIRPVIEAQYPKPYQDTVRRINILFDHLNNGDLLDGQTVGDMLTLSTAISNKDYDTAANIQRDIVSTRSDQGARWLAGVKRLIDMGRAVVA